MNKVIYSSLVALAILSSCKKDQKDTLADLTASATDQAMAENEFNSVFETADNVLRNDPDFKSADDFLPTCATVTKDTALKILTIDFGTVNCLCNDGMYRRGKIRISHAGKYRAPGSVVTIQLQDYYVNDHLHTGTKTIENLGDSTGNYKFRYTVADASIAFADGTIRKWNKTATLERTEGEATLTPWDDTYMVTGSSTGTNRRGRNFTAVTTTPLKKKMQLGCARNFVSGMVTITDDAGNSLVLNYDPIGGEPCDKIAEVIVNGGEPRRITLR